MNRIITKAKCSDISSEGKGVVKLGRDVCFVDGLFIGEEADVEVLYHRAGVYYGKVKKLYTLSKDRIQPKCKVCTSCGGCQYQQINYKTQLEYKTKRVPPVHFGRRPPQSNCPSRTVPRPGSRTRVRH